MIDCQHIETAKWILKRTQPIYYNYPFDEEYESKRAEFARLRITNHYCHELEVLNRD